MACVAVAATAKGSSSSAKESKIPLYNDYWAYFNSRKLISEDGQECYYIGIIDILQDFSTKKKIERTIKSVVHGVGQSSAVPPDLYATRFLRFIKEKVFKI